MKSRHLAAAPGFDPNFATACGPTLGEQAAQHRRRHFLEPGDQRIDGQPALGLEGTRTVTHLAAMPASRPGPAVRQHRAVRRRHSEQRLRVQVRLRVRLDPLDLVIGHGHREPVPAHRVHQLRVRGRPERQQNRRPGQRRDERECARTRDSCPRALRSLRGRRRPSRRCPAPRWPPLVSSLWHCLNCGGHDDEDRARQS